MPAAADDPGVQDGKRLYHVTINGQSTLSLSSFTNVVSGSVTLKDTWVWAKSPEESLKAAILSDTLRMTRKGDPAGGMRLPFMDSHFFKLKAINWQNYYGDGFYDTYITGQTLLENKWNEGCIHVRIDVPWVEADVDSSNDSGFDASASSNHSKDEDRTEDDSDKSGKIILVNNSDADNDLIPDFADGFDWDGISGNEDDLPPSAEQDERFVPITVTIPRTVDLSLARLKIEYDGSDPAALQRTGSGTADDPYIYTADSGHLRLWTKDGDVTRSSQAFNAGTPDPSKGYYVPPTDGSSSYSGADLTRLGFTTGKRSITLYIEAVDKSDTLADQRIAITVDPGAESGGQFAATDAIRLTSASLELLRGDVDPDSGRGALGDADSVLHPIMLGEILPASDPSPHVVLDSVSVDNIHRNSAAQIVGTIRFSGHAASPLADIVPDNEDDPSSAAVFVNGQHIEDTITNRQSEATSLLRPYAASYAFSDTLIDVPLAASGNSVTVQVSDPGTGNTGFDTATFSVSAVNVLPPTEVGGLLNLPMPLLLKIDFGSGSSLEEVAQAGPLSPAWSAAHWSIATGHSADFAEFGFRRPDTRSATATVHRPVRSPKPAVSRSPFVPFVVRRKLSKG